MTSNERVEVFLQKQKDDLLEMSINKLWSLIGLLNKLLGWVCLKARRLEWFF